MSRGERPLDAGDVLGVEVPGGVGQPALEGAAVPLGPDRLGADQPGSRVLGSAAAARPRRLGSAAAKSSASRWSLARRTRAGGDGPGHLGVEVLRLDPLEAVAEDVFEGSAPDESQGLGAQRDGVRPAAGVGLAAQAQEGGPVQRRRRASR